MQCMKNEKASCDAPSNSQIEKVDTKKAVTDSSTNTMKKRKGSEKFVLDLNDRNKYTKEVSV